MPRASSPQQSQAASPTASTQFSSSSSPAPNSKGSRKPHSSSINGGNTSFKSSLNNPPSKPRLTAHQKSDNHKEAENRRRNGIRDQYVALSHLVPGTEGQAKSEEKMLVKTAEYMKQLLEDRRALTAQLEAVGGEASDLMLSDSEWGGPEWDPKCENEYWKRRAERIAEQGYDEADEGVDDRPGSKG
jgi:Helix-loop-helix DNA-binding domain